MKTPALPPDEPGRLEALHGYEILDSAPEADFDALVRIASQLMGTPIALVSLVDSNRQWFKARVGLAATETPRDVSFCGHAVAESRLLVVPDAFADERFSDNPLVTDAPHVRFYAGAPLIGPDGHCLGTLCAIDHVAREASKEQLSALEDLAKQVVNQLELRRRIHQSEAALAAERSARDSLERHALCLTRLHQVSARHSDDLKSKLTALLEVGVEALRLEGAVIGRFRNDHYRVTHAWPEHADWRRGERHLAAETSADLIRRKGAVCTFPSLATDAPDVVCHREFGVECLMGAPLSDGDVVTGVVSFFSREPRREGFDEAELTIVRIIRDWVANEIDRDRVQAALREQALGELVGEKLGRSNERQTFFDAAHDMLVVGNFHGYFTELNPAAERILGYSTEELKSRPYTDFIHPDDVEATEQAAREAVLAGARSDFENRYRRADGSYVWLLWSMTADPARQSVYATARDISARKQVERLKSEFVSTVSHELRTPLTSIRGSLGLLLGGAVGSVSEDAKPLLEMACSNTDRLVRLINDMLDIDKIESGKLRLRRQPVDLSKILGDAIVANRTFGEQHGVSFDGQLPEAAAPVEGDPDRLTQVMDNLLSNAAKYAPGTGSVKVRLGRSNGDWRIEVIDRGPGIPESFRPRIFERFSQVDSSSTKLVGGTGLGLNIVRSIVELHDGEIGFDSVEGQGTTFWLRLPALEAPMVAQAPTGGENADDWVISILVVEDDPDIARLIAMMLERRKVRCEIAPDASTAMACLEDRKFDAITLDLNLPGESGVDLYRRLRERFGSGLPPVVVVSAIADAGEIELNGDALGIVDWINKPIDAERLQHAVQTAVGTTSRARVLHVEDDPSLRAITRQQLSGLAEVAPAATLGEARERLAKEDFDLVIVDLGLPDGHGKSLIEEVKASPHPVPIVIYSGGDLDASLEALASAVLVKTRDSEHDLLDTIDRLLDRVV